MLLSVISIAYNNLKGLEKTLEIFMDGQFSNDVEIVIIDGGSSDGTLEFLQNQRLTANWVSEKDKGIYNAMNKGLARANGDYVWFLNSGDYAFSAQAVKNVLAKLEHHPDALYGETMMVDPEGRHIGTRSGISTRKLPAQLDWKSFRLGMNVSHQSFIIRRSLALPYDESYRYVADIDWMISCLKNCRTIINIREVIACFTMDGFSSANRRSSNRERYRVLQKHYGFIPNIWSHIRILWRKLLGMKKV